MKNCLSCDNQIFNNQKHCSETCYNTYLKKIIREEIVLNNNRSQKFKPLDNNLFQKYNCIPKEYRYSVINLINKGYNKTFLKASLSIIGRESSYGSGLRYNITSPIKSILSWFGKDASLGPAQMKQSTANQLKIKNDITTIEGSLIAVYKFLMRSYAIAKENGYSTNNPSSNFKEGTGNAALDISIASYNIGVGRITKYCKTNDANIKRPCKLSGKLVEQWDNPNLIFPYTPNKKNKQYKVSYTYVPNYLPNIPTKRWDGVDITTYGYVKEVANKMKGFNCF